MDIDEEDLPHRRALRAQRSPPQAKPVLALDSTSGMVQTAQMATEQVLNSLLQIAVSGMSESARVAACKEILDRAHGKPSQSVVVYEGAKNRRAAWDAVDAEFTDG